MHSRLAAHERQTMKTMEQNHRGKTVLITGASNGFGMEFAKLFAADGFNLILVARSTERLRELGYQLQDEHQLEKVSIITADLSKPEAPQEVYDKVRESGIWVDVLVNNAGAGLHGEFAKTDLQQELAMMQLNMNTTVHLTKLFLQDMKRQNEGKILNLASLVSFLPSPLMTVYAATKAFILSFSEGLAAELKDSNITVTALCPGASNTMFFLRAGAAHVRAAQGDLAEPEDVARDGYEALMNGKTRIVSGTANKAVANLSTLMPDKAKTGIMHHLMQEEEDGKEV